MSHVVWYKDRQYRKRRDGAWLTFAAAKWIRIKNDKLIQRLDKKVRDRYVRQYPQGNSYC